VLELAGVDHVVLGIDPPPRSSKDHAEEALVLAQKLAMHPSPPRLWLLTAGGQKRPDAAGWRTAALWGLARGLAHEHPGLRPSLIDLPASPADSDLDAAAACLLAADQEDQVAISDGRVAVARLQRFDPPSTAEPTLRADAAWLVTGGFGGLGLAVTRHLVTRGARHLWLAGRTVPESAAAAIAELRGQGVAVHAESCNVADRDAVARLLDAIDRPLEGVVHAAGVLSDGQVLGLDQAAMRRVFDPKVIGAGNLDALTRDRDPAHFILFSSAVGTLGAPGQANHCAANAALDALAAQRRAAGLAAQSIAWGPWSEIGAAAAVREGAERSGIGAITPAAGLALLDVVLAAPAASLPPVIVAVPLDVAEWRRGHAGIEASRLLSELEQPVIAASVSTQTSQPLRHRIEATAPTARLSRLREELAAVLGRVLRTPAREIEGHIPFGMLGLTSLLGLEIRNALEAGLGLRLPATLIWAHPTLDALTGHLAGLLSIAEPPAALDDVPADIRDMDAAATAAALDRELAEVLNGTGGADG
jgi:NADP-dependent 3-hydroxy acid dehydrogenase YdfG